MLFDLDDLRPDAPRVPAAISRREGVLLSLVAHGAMALLVIFPPFDGAAATPARFVAPEPAVTFVQMLTRNDRTAMAIRPPEASDQDRRSATRERPRTADNPMPFSRGATPEKTQGAPEERPAGSEAVAVPVERTAPDAPAPAVSTADLSGALRDLKRYLQDQNFDNRRGGLTDQDPDIQFDAKGVEFGPWIRRFIAQVKRNWLIPTNAMSESGRVVITFNVMKDGSIRDLQIVRPCAISSFNTAALNSLKLSNPTVALPAEYPADRAFFTVTFHYNDGLGR